MGSDRRHARPPGPSLIRHLARDPGRHSRTRSSRARTSSPLAAQPRLRGVIVARPFLRVVRYVWPSARSVSLPHRPLRAPTAGAVRDRPRRSDGSELANHRRGTAARHTGARSDGAVCSAVISSTLPQSSARSASGQFDGQHQPNDGRKREDFRANSWGRSTRTVSHA